MNYYEILGVTPSSDIAEIKCAYRKLARKFHPDINPNGGSRFKEISKAYDTLSNIEKRKQYDILNGIFKTEKQVEQDTNKQSVKTEKNHTKNKKDFSFNTFFNSSPINRAPKTEPINGENIHTDVPISISEAINGTEKTINVMHTELCPRCKGRKFINGNKCNVCNGLGEYSQHKKINVKIPAKVKHGTKLRIKGEGGNGQFGGSNGDLFLEIKIEQNSKIKYENENVLYSVPIAPFEAVLGADISIMTIDGYTKLKIPPNTNSGQKFRLKGQGIKKNGKVGDLIITVTIEIPKTLSDDEIKLYEKLKKISADNIRENLLND